MKFTQQQIDEGVRELVLALLATATTGASMKYTIDQIKASREPIEVKMQAAEIAKDLSDNSEFDKAMNSILQDNQLALQTDKTPVLVKPLKRYDTTPQNIEDVTIDDYSNFIIPSEIYGSSLKNPKNKKFLKPYRDDVGLWTIGIGHLIGRGSDADMQKFVRTNGPNISMNTLLQMFNKDVLKHVQIAQRTFRNEWDTFSPNLKKALVDISFRGDLLNPKSKADFNFVRQLKNRDFKKAAASYLDHKEYKKRISEGGADGVVKRMNRNAKIIASEITSNQT